MVAVHGRLWCGNVDIFARTQVYVMMSVFSLHVAVDGANNFLLIVIVNIPY